MSGTRTRRQLVFAAFVAIPAAAGALRSRSSNSGGQDQPGATPLATPATPIATPVTANRPVSVAGEVTIQMTDDRYRPSLVQATNGHPLEITLENTGTRPHAFQIPKLKVDVTLDPGESETITITDPSLGEFPFSSDSPGDEKFSGMLVFYI